MDSIYNTPYLDSLKIMSSINIIGVGTDFFASPILLSITSQDTMNGFYVGEPNIGGGRGGHMPPVHRQHYPCMVYHCCYCI